MSDELRDPTSPVRDDDGMVFLSYSRRDRDAVRAVVERLEVGGRSVWIDWKDIPPTATWKHELEEAIVKAYAVIFMITPHSAASAECGDELALAARFKKKIVPLLLQRTSPDALPETVKPIQWIDLVEDMPAGLQQLDVALTTDLPWVRDHTRLLVRAREWEANQRDNGFLLRGKDLTRAEAWFASSANKEPAPITLQAELISSSRRRANTLQRALLVSVSAALVITAALAVATHVQSRERERQRQIAVAKQAGAQAVLVRDQRGSGLLVSALLAMESTRRLMDLGESSIEGAQALAHALQLLPRRVHWLDHSSTVRDVQLDSTGTWLATAAGRSARVWRVSSGELHKQVDHDATVAGVSIDDGARYLLARLESSGRRSYTLSDLGSGARVPVPGTTLRLEFAVMSPSGRLYAIADHNDVEVYAVQGPALQRRIAASGQVADVRFLADDTLQIDSGSELDRPRDRSERPVQITRESHQAGLATSTFTAAVSTAGPASAFRLDPRLRYLITSSTSLSRSAILMPTSLQLWENTTTPGDVPEAGEPADSGARAGGEGSFRPASVLNFDRGIGGLTFSADGSRFVTVSGDYRVQLWQTHSARELQRVDHGRSAWAASLVRVHRGDGSTAAVDLATGGGDGYAGVWQTTTALIDRRDDRQPRQVTRAMRFSADGEVLAVTTTTGFELWNVKAGVLIARHRQRYGADASAQIPGIHPHARTPVFAANDRDVIVPGREATLILDRTGRLQRELSYDRADVVALSPTADIVAVASDARVQVLRSADGDLVAEWPRPRLRDMVIDRDSRYVAAFGRDGLSVFDVRERRPVDVARFGTAGSLAFSPDGQLFAIADTAVVRVYEMRTSFSEAALAGELRPIARPSLSDETTEPPSISAIAFSPDSRILAAAWANQSLTLWDVATRTQLLQEPVDLFQSLVFSPDASRFAVFGSNVPIRIWEGLDRLAPREVLRIPHRENVRTMTFSPDGRVLASASSDDVIALSPVTLPDLLAQTTQRLSRNLTHLEWRYYFGDEPYRCTSEALPDCPQVQRGR